jgi:ARG and Rhodanese-Phosphatase-superfamily-associated Protein domain
MKLRSIICTALILTFGALTAVQAQSYKVSKAYIHNNLSIFLIHGNDQYKSDNILTLGEAMENKQFVVYETSDVNELQVQNLSKTHDVFIQSGDIVKGGKQDRVLAVSIIIPARSGKIRIQAFCVESGRWSKRGKEDNGKFSSSQERIVSKELKLAANKSKSQSEVWNEVKKAQDSISKNVGVNVKSGKSSTSLQLSLENKEVKATIEKYLDALSGITARKKDVIGYAFAINGKINSADIYVSNSLFRKLWPRMLKAAAVEAVAKMDENAYSTVTPGNVLAFLTDSQKGSSKEEVVSKSSKVITREDKENIMFEAIDSVRKLVIHKSYVKLD